MKQTNMPLEEKKKKIHSFLSNRGNKYKAKPTIVDGIKFPSMAEAEYYRLCKARPEVVHIDTHVAVTMPYGEGDKREVIRYKIDLILWIQDHESIRPRPEAHEVKGMETADFKIKHKIFNATHPLAPLKVFKKIGKNFKQIY